MPVAQDIVNRHDKNYLMSKVTLQGYITVPTEDLAAVEAELPNHITLTLAEPGCISFSVEQSYDNPNRFQVREEFTDQDAFRNHQQRVRDSKWGKVTLNVERHYTIVDSNET